MNRIMGEKHPSNWSDSEASNYTDTLGLFNPPKDAKKILVLGCGPGVGVMKAAEKSAPDVTFVAVDLNQKYIDLAKIHTSDKVVFIRGDFEDFFDILNEDKFDYVHCMGILSWVSPRVALNIIENLPLVLNKGGQVIFNYENAIWKESYRIFREIGRDAFKAFGDIKKGNEMIYALSRTARFANDENLKRLIEDLERSRFEIFHFLAQEDWHPMFSWDISYRMRDLGFKYNPEHSCNSNLIKESNDPVECHRVEIWEKC